MLMALPPKRTKVFMLELIQIARLLHIVYLEKFTKDCVIPVTMQNNSLIYAELYTTGKSFVAPLDQKLGAPMQVWFFLSLVSTQ